MTYGIEKSIIFGIFPIFIAHHQRRNERGQGSTISRVQNHCRGSESYNSVISTFFNTVHLLPKGLRFEHAGAKLVFCPSRHLTSLRPCTSRLSSQNDEFFLQKYLFIRQTINHTPFKQTVVDYCQSHLTIENNLKVEKGILFRKHAQLYPPKKTLGVRVETNIPKNSRTMIMLAPFPGRCLLHNTGIENDQTTFFHVTAGNVKFAVSE